MIKEGEMAPAGQEIQGLQGQTFPTSLCCTWDETEDGYTLIYVGFVSWPFGERDAEPRNNNEDDEGDMRKKDPEYWR